MDGWMNRWMHGWMDDDLAYLQEIGVAQRQPNPNQAKIVQNVVYSIPVYTIISYLKCRKEFSDWNWSELQVILMSCSKM